MSPDNAGGQQVVAGRPARAMLHKCANPNCLTRFRHLRRGKLFQIELGYLETTAVGQPSARRSRPLRRVERYWLCDECAGQLTLAFDPAYGIVTVPHPGIGTPPVPVSLPWNSLGARAHSGLGIQQSRMEMRGLS